jgi:hypothetical protein
MPVARRASVIYWDLWSGDAFVDVAGKGVPDAG